MTGLRKAKKTVLGGIAHTKANFKWLAEHYLQTCREGLVSIGEAQAIAEVEEEATQEYEAELRVRHRAGSSSTYQPSRGNPVPGRGLGGASSRRLGSSPPHKFRNIECAQSRDPNESSDDDILDTGVDLSD